MSKHTEGPWNTRQYKTYTDKEGGQISISAKDWDTLAIAYQHCCKDPEEGEANARLISAAPELLEACKSVKNRLDDLMIPTPLEQTLLDIVTQAIARAEGK